MRATTLSCLFCYPAPPPTQIFTLSLHDALPISVGHAELREGEPRILAAGERVHTPALQGVERGALRSLGHEEDGDRKSTRLNSSHVAISYAVFCLKKKKNNKNQTVHATTVSCD